MIVKTLFGSIKYLVFENVNVLLNGDITFLLLDNNENEYAVSNKKLNLTLMRKFKTKRNFKDKNNVYTPLIKFILINGNKTKNYIKNDEFSTIQYDDKNKIDNKNPYPHLLKFNNGECKFNVFNLANTENFITLKKF